jgi:ribonuclease HI
VSEPYFTHVACDASWDPGTGLAAVAACAPGRPLAGRIVPAEKASDAECLALLAAMDVCAGEQMRCVEFRCDAKGVVDAIHGSRDAGELLIQIRRRLQIPPCSGVWRVQWVHRSNTQSAHRLADLLWKAFNAGRALDAAVVD